MAVALCAVIAKRLPARRHEYVFASSRYQWIVPRDIMKKRMYVLIILFAVAVIALPHCATRRAAEPAALKADAAKADENVIAPSTPVGSIYRLNAAKKEVLVKTNRIFRMGERLYVEIDSARAMMTATFPMMTSSKCELEAKDRKCFGRLVKGMPVYAYMPGEKKAARSEPKAGDTRTIGGMEFVYIPAGSFMMGSSDGERNDEERPLHRVTLDGFWMGKYEVTQGQYREIMGINPSYFKKEGWFSNSKRHPVENVTWRDAVDFCAKFAARHGIAVRLPTEAEWEYAARAGTNTRYYWGNEIDNNYLWHWNNSEGTTHRVGEKRPNAFGLYDMTGNVWEWCSDWYGEQYYRESPEKNPKGPDSGQYRILRGGSWLGSGCSDSSAVRVSYLPDSWYGIIGFRVVVPSAGK